MNELLFSIVLGVVATPFALIGLLLLAGSVGAAAQRMRLLLFGASAMGQVVGFVEKKKQPPKTSETAIDMSSPKPFLRVAFTDERGQRREVTTDVSVSPQHYREGDDVPLLYMPGRPESFVVRQFKLMWAAPVLFGAFGLLLLIPPLGIAGYLWPAVGAWLLQAMRPASVWLLPLLAIGVPALFAFLGIHMIFDRRRRLREDYRTEGVVVETGVLRNGGKRTPWVRIAYRDAAGTEQERKIATGFGPAPQEGQSVPLLVDRTYAQDVLRNEPWELWFVPFLALTLGTVAALAAGWAWWTGELAWK